MATVPKSLFSPRSRPSLPAAPSPPPPFAMAPARHPARPERRGHGSGTLLLLAILAAGLAIALVTVTQSLLVGVIPFTLACGLAIRGTLSGIAELRHARGAVAVDLTLLSIAGNLVMTAFGLLSALMSVGGATRGRQLRSFGRVLLPPIRRGGSWAGCVLGALDVRVPEPSRRALARQWRENGRTEHASVAAFARLTLDLVALGAPPKLVAEANRDAIDEIRHAELCFSLARALDGANEGPGPFPAPRRANTLPRIRTLALAGLAVDSLLDGALHEGVSARIIARLAKRCEDPATRAVLAELAADEGRHAAHGWHVVEWCLAEGGHPVADALRGAVKIIPLRVQSGTAEPARDGSWERWGVPGLNLEAEEYAAARVRIIRRVDTMIGATLAVAA